MKFWFGILAFIAGYMKPEQIHLSWTEKSEEMRVTWVTQQSVLTTSYVAYRPVNCPQENLVYNYVEAEVLSYNPDEDFTRFIQIYKATMTEILPNCNYDFQVGTTFAWSGIFQFKGRTPDYSGNKTDEPVDLVIFGDLGAGPVAIPTIDSLIDVTNEGEIDGMLHLGDLAYDLEHQNGRKGDLFGREIEPIATQVPYMTIPGNHDYGKNGTHYKVRYNMPVNDVNQGNNSFYSFVLGAARFILFNTEVYWRSHEIWEHQERWLREELDRANADRDNHPWVIVMTHHPMYCSINTREPARTQSDCYEDTLQLQGLFEDLFYDQGVDFFIAGHVHNYERLAPIYKNITIESEIHEKNYYRNPQAPIHITTGVAGNRKEHNDASVPTPQLWSIVQSDLYGFGRMWVSNKTHIRWEEFDAANKDSIDYLVVEKTSNRYNSTLGI